VADELVGSYMISSRGAKPRRNILNARQAGEEEKEKELAAIRSMTLRPQARSFNTRYASDIDTYFVNLRPISFIATLCVFSIR
jgi:hypothetical protein